MNGTLQSLLAQCFGRSAQPTDAPQSADIPEVTAEQKAQTLQYIRENLYQAARDIDQKAQELKDNAAYSTCGIGAKNPTGWFLGFSGNIDLKQLTGYDKLALKPALKEVNDVCQRHNISLRIVGLGSLPYSALTTEFFSRSNRSGQDFMVVVNARRPYNADFNPYDDEQVQQKLGPNRHKGPVQ